MKSNINLKDPYEYNYNFISFQGNLLSVQINYVHFELINFLAFFITRQFV